MVDEGSHVDATDQQGATTHIISFVRCHSNVKLPSSFYQDRLGTSIGKALLKTRDDRAFFAGRTPLHLAVVGGHVAAIEILATKTADGGAEAELELEDGAVGKRLLVVLFWSSSFVCCWIELV